MPVSHSAGSELELQAPWFVVSFFTWGESVGGNQPEGSPERKADRCFLEDEEDSGNLWKEQGIEGQPYLSFV